MKRNKKGKLYITNDLYILSFVVLGIVLLATKNFLIGAIQIALTAVIFILTIVFRLHYKNKIKDMLESVSLSANTRNDALLSFPMPIVLLDSKGYVVWYNAELRNIFSDKNLNECTITDLFSEFDMSLLTSERTSNGFVLELSYDNRVYKAIGNMPKSASDSNNSVTIMYLDDITPVFELRQKYIDEKPVVCFINIDNYDELMDSTPSSVVPQLQAELYKTINDWVSENNGIILKYEKDKYFVGFEYKCIETFVKNKFDVLSKVRAIDTKNSIPASISIGIGMNGQCLSENDSYAKSALNMALGRGGDQAVIKDDEQFRFYGAATKEYEKSTRVKARVVSFALSGLINNADNVVVLTHKNADIDGVGAAFGLLRICRIHNKPMTIAMESYDKTVAKILTKLDSIDEYDGLIITNEEAKDKIGENTLVIMVDAHKISLLEDPSLISNKTQIVVIDHHRRTADFVEHPALVYHEPYASSTCEMVTEILQYTSNKMSLTKFEAEALYSGIVVDTKNFTFKTGVRTFEAASFLRKQGVDTVAVKTVFQQDLNTYIKRSEIIKRAEIIREKIAISVAPFSSDITQTVIAQAADELLNIKGIIASFVIRELDGNVNISGRSLGEINVQLILEKLGGGGHMTIAGAQLDSISADTAKEQLISAIDEYYADNENQ